MLFEQDSWNISSNGYAQISVFLFFFYTENQLFITICHCLFPLICARGPKVR